MGIVSSPSHELMWLSAIRTAVRHRHHQRPAYSSLLFSTEGWDVSGPAGRVSVIGFSSRGLNSHTSMRLAIMIKSTTTQNPAIIMGLASEMVDTIKSSRFMLFVFLSTGPRDRSPLSRMVRRMGGKAWKISYPSPLQGLFSNRETCRILAYGMSGIHILPGIHFNPRPHLQRL